MIWNTIISPLALRLLLRHWHRKGERGSLSMVQVTLNQMAAGGIYDHVGGGFARYSVDERWLVPPFVYGVCASQFPPRA